MITADTHVIVWNALQPDRLSRKAKRAISVANEEDGIIFCEISLWEIAMLIRKGRIRIDVGYQEFIGLVSESNKYVFKGITPDIAELSADLLSGGKKDPADAIIAATSVVEKAEIVTADKALRASKSIATIW